MSERKTPAGTTVGVSEPYRYVERCDHLTDDGRCRLAIERPETDIAFAHERRHEEYRCPIVADGDGVDEGAEFPWHRCPHFRSRQRDRACVRCGLEERLVPTGDERPLLEEHHLAYRDAERSIGHEITVSLCRWCHAKVHRSWARLDDDVSPTPEAIAAREARRSDELEELQFPTAAERFGQPSSEDESSRQ